MIMMKLVNNKELLFLMCLSSKFPQIATKHLTQHCVNSVNRLTPNDQYMGRTTPLTSKRCILYIYSTNVGTE